MCKGDYFRIIMLNIYNVCFVGFNVPLTVFQSFWDTFCLHKTDSFASLWYPTVDKWNDTTPSHIILTPGLTSPGTNLMCWASSTRDIPVPFWA